ncbi:MAG: Hsp20/alpha crystallin family protein [Syntrophorhabdaceae bacterium]|nr:Hsp20/alpha crystallin family protein [Syntrophorhabdaceae bacterium]MDD4196686.1 Hsp20/alpha crystallin family protein [Syntrophorhabdaceae bacterium]HOC45248.1 Hsp20/alpha crystallin family protein [Syntrophorhabdaceae bacterium]
MLLLRRPHYWPASGWRGPFEELERMRRQMDLMSAALFRAPSVETAAGVFPMMNVTEDGDNYYIRAELPGMKADELAITVTANSISISGERKLAVEDEKAQYHRREREGGKFNRIVSLPTQIETEKVTARCTDGILAVTLPKAESAKPKRITVNLS